MFRVLRAVVLALIFVCVAQAAEASFATKHAIILVLDGERYTETWGDPTHQYIPHMAKELAPQAAIYTHFTNQGRTETSPGHSTLVTGVYQMNVANDGKNRILPSNPTMFQTYRKATNAPESDTWVITSKDKLDICGDCARSDWKGDFTASLSCGRAGFGTGYREDGPTIDVVCKTIARDHPKLMIINLKEPDVQGHAAEEKPEVGMHGAHWTLYLNAIKSCDELAVNLWQFIQKDPVMANTTALFITNDHGRHTRYFRDHGDACEGCRHIVLYALGPDFKKGAIIDTPAEQIDVAPTIAAMLHFPLPEAKGRVMTELFATARPGLASAPKPAAPAEKKPVPVH